jgi:hypothetical protein
LPAGVFLLEENMTDTEILTLVDRLERCLLSGDEFRHQDHLAAAVVYLYASDLESAVDKMRATLVRFSSHHGAGKKYHETMTRFWLEMTEKRLDRNVCLRESVHRIQAELGDKNIVNQYYTAERIGSPEAKAQWVEPDLMPLSNAPRPSNGK